MASSRPSADPVPYVALIAFIPGALGLRLNALRQALVPGCPFQSHVTILPPRRLSTPGAELIQALDRMLDGAGPFDVGLGEVAVFAASGVIYLEVTRGVERLRGMHDLLARDEFAGTEVYPYHPHVTLAQEIPPDQTDEKLHQARSDWAKWNGERTFR